MRDRLNGVLAFVQAADAGSFALAARHMSLSRSAVGKSIARTRAATRHAFVSSHDAQSDADGRWPNFL